MPTIVLISVSPIKIDWNEHELSFCREWSFMSKKLIGTTLLLGLITIANAQPIPYIQGCINIRWSGTTLEADCPNLTISQDLPPYRFTSLPCANTCYPPMIQATSNGFLQCAQVDVPNIPAEAYGSYGTPYMPPVIRQQIEQAEQQICN